MSSQVTASGWDFNQRKVSYKQQPTKQRFPSDDAALLTLSGFKEITLFFSYSFLSRIVEIVTRNTHTFNIVYTNFSTITSTLL